MKRSTESPAVSVGWLDVWGKVAMKDKRKARGSLVLQKGNPASSPSPARYWPFVLVHLAREPLKLVG